MASCAMPAAPNMVVKTETPIVRKAREGVMEFLLVSVRVAVVIQRVAARLSPWSALACKAVKASGLC